MSKVILKAMVPIVKNARERVQLQDSELIPVEGYAAEYDVPIERWYGTIELAAGCFADSLDNPESIVILAQHDSWTPVGKASEFRESDESLYLRCLINPEIQAGAEILSNIKHGILTGFSVGFDIIETETRKEGEGPGSYEVEVITKAKLHEVSIVTFPAIASARVQQEAQRRPKLLSKAHEAADRLLAA